MNLRGWLFRIAHNKAIDFLRRYEHQHTDSLSDHPPPAAEDARVDVIGRTQRRGAELVGEYVHGYSLQDDWRGDADVEVASQS